MAPAYGLYSGNEFLFPKGLRLVCWGVGLVSNTQISFDEAYGSIREGRLKVRDVKLRSIGNTSKDFDLHINSFEIVYGNTLLTLIREFEARKKEEINIEKLYIKGITGKVDIIGDSEPLPDFCLQELAMENIQLEVTDRTNKVEKSGPFTFPPVALYRLYGRNLHSNNIAQDLFMKSSFLASLGAGVAGLETRNLGISFMAKNLPVGIISKYLNEPFSWFPHALLDAEINDVVKNKTHVMQIDVKLHKLHPDSDRASSTSGKFAIPAISSYMKTNNSISLSFPLQLQENQFTVKDISRQITIHLLQRAVKEGSEKAGQKWEEIKKLVNDSVQNLSQ
eukprot:Phypoly_transcript_12693.p1 GENE.Phypoly_transcript_12693~~Phypoly_transcript_12693.p1  ORF type:complete len:358 (+),score=49.24 Phypoly_transcript_12693:69-1076(+)